jgi:signal peptidase
MARPNPPSHDAPPEWFAAPAVAEEVDMLRHWVAGLSAEVARLRDERDAARRELARLQAELDALRAQAARGAPAAAPASETAAGASAAPRSSSLLHRATMWLRRLGRSATALVVLGGVVAVVGARLLPYQLYVMTSNSMAPSLPAGSLLLVQPTAPTAIWPGEVIVFQSPLDARGTVTHRVVSITVEAEGVVLQTRGDANPAVDPWRVSAGAVRGKVVAAVPLVGYALLALQHPGGGLGVGLGLPPAGTSGSGW